MKWCDKCGSILDDDDPEDIITDLIWRFDNEKGWDKEEIIKELKKVYHV